MEGSDYPARWPAAQWGFTLLGIRFPHVLVLQLGCFLPFRLTVDGGRWRDRSWRKRVKSGLANAGVKGMG